KLAERARRETEIMHRIVEAQEGERNRIARGLHDKLGQQMTALRLRVEAIAEECSADEKLRDAIGLVRTSAVELDRDLGFLSWELKPTELEDLGLQNALSSFVREWSQRHGIEADFQASLNDAKDLRLQPEAETNLYRITQEALNNALQHAHATRVSVLLQRRKDDLVLIVEDDGSGFEPASISSTPASGIGLAGMKERAALLGGSLDLDTTPGQGTSIIVRIPGAKWQPAGAVTAAI
ncbi:MAG TPA: sensor histidine kinase, partial [Pyrinomonadaceae bacterium]|nr:sensor histidine kinase [Pyrinomonadaceae bacterium]